MTAGIWFLRSDMISRQLLKQLLLRLGVINRKDLGLEYAIYEQKCS